MEKFQALKFASVEKRQISGMLSSSINNEQIFQNAGIIKYKKYSLISLIKVKAKSSAGIYDECSEYCQGHHLLLWNKIT